MEEILERLLAGDFSVDEALRLLRAEHVEAVGDMARLDPTRQRRKGVPEVIYAPGKSPSTVAELARRMLQATGVALISRVSPEVDAGLRALGTDVDVYGQARRLRSNPRPPRARGHVAILTAGTSDVDVAEEARMVAETMGARVSRAYDVGVAALHRLTEPLQAMVSEDPDAFIVVAGMEGALPSVVAGLVAAPVIAVPTSTGYGAGGRGLAALLAMLQSCSPGVTVVNIDNGVGAGATAALIAARAGARQKA